MQPGRVQVGTIIHHQSSRLKGGEGNLRLGFAGTLGGGEGTPFPCCLQALAADSLKPDKPDEEAQMQSFSFLCEQQLGSHPELHGAEQPQTLWKGSNAPLVDGKSKSEIFPVLQRHQTFIILSVLVFVLVTRHCSENMCLCRMGTLQPLIPLKYSHLCLPTLSGWKK